MDRATTPSPTSAVARRKPPRLAPTPIDAIYASDLRRAADTARFIAEAAGLEVVEHPALRERHWGDAEGKDWEKLQARFGANVYAGAGHIPNEEPHEVFLQRVIPIFRELHERHVDDRVIVVAHGRTILGVLSHLFGVMPSELPRFNIANTSFTTIESIDPPSLGPINDHAHLTAEPDLL